MVASIVVPNQIEAFSLEDYLQNPPEHMEWVDGQLVEKTGMTLKHGRIQAKVATYWRNYKDNHNLGGEVYTEAPCRTNNQIRRPDVAYLTPELLAQFGDSNVLPQSFPLIAEIISPTDTAEDVFAKANEYLESGCQEIWLVLPDSQWIVVITGQQRLLFSKGEVVSTQTILEEFSVAVDELLG
ncbi:MAG: Uma2 family endonuclease [Symplocastrum torsivum CPER-KK1]|jgi:Uma2 family endonuclease|uniref:Uma2 family endonuclease n=1 Tax=Symplocastrum torsivum CPER-KK1 TaxID=450513 RepID=A0A951PLY8_9CYAN|nr:Uma2 family endonuclease [Symplocastrum torsivum CPER-KK1]